MSAVQPFRFMPASPCLSAEDEGGGSAGNQQASDDLVRGQTFAQEDPRKQDDKHHAQLVDRRYGGRRAELQRAEVANPRQAGCDARENEKEPGAARDRANRIVSAQRNGDGPGKNQHHSGADGSGQVGVDAGDTDLGQDRRRCCEECRKKRPKKPGHALRICGPAAIRPNSADKLRQLVFKRCDASAELRDIALEGCNSIRNSVVRPLYRLCGTS
jgi:hypothetical protein